MAAQDKPLDVQPAIFGSSNRRPPPKPVRPQEVRTGFFRRTVTPSQALGWALSDIVTLPASDRPFVRYVWIPPWADGNWHAGLSFAANTACCRGPSVNLPTVLAQGYLLRWDLRGFARDDKDVEELIETWDGLAVNEPYFHVKRENKVDQVIKVPKKVVRNGRRVTIKVNKTITKSSFVAVIAPHVSRKYAESMASMNLSPALVYRADWLTHRLLSTLEGGRYYSFRGIKRSPDKDKSDQVFFLEQFAGVSEKRVQQLQGDERIALFFSQVTGKARRVDGFRGIAGRASTNQIWITHDPKDNDNDARQHPFYNVIAFDDAARELILEGNTGLHVFALFNDRGELQVSVPENIAKDHTIPAPHTAILQPAIGCIRCHGPDRGLRDTPNQLKRLLSGQVNVIDDFTNSKNKTRVQNLARIAGLYGGNFERRILDGRDDYDAAVERVTLGVGSREASQIVAAIYASWRYESVTPFRACQELGLKVADESTAVTVLQKQVQNYAADRQTGIIREDPTIAALRQGIAVRRQDFDRVFNDLILRTQQKKGAQR